MDIVTLVLFVAGIGLLVAGAEALVRGASRLAAAVGISPLVIGLTIVAYGTSSPELAVSLRSSIVGQADIAIGNVVGSNIANVLLVLGTAAVVAPLLVSRRLLVLDVPLMIGVSLLLPLLALDGKLGRLDGILLFAGSLTYTIWSIWESRRESAQVEAEFAREFGDGKGRSRARWIGYVALVIAGLGLLVLGANWLVSGAVAVARHLGLSELIIGLTIVAVGTSMPEVATSMVASARGEGDIAIGNVVGSNISNILTVLGLTSIVAPHGIGVPAAALRFDIPVMIAVAIGCLPVFFVGNIIHRWEGALFLGYYVAYTLYLILNASQHSALPMFSTMMLAFVIPLTALTFLILVVRDLRARLRKRHPSPL